MSLSLKSCIMDPKTLARKQLILEQQRKSAQHGEFFFAKFLVDNGLRESPVFVVSNDNDKNDVIVCKCTKQPAKSDFDVQVKLKQDTFVRTNKVYTIERSQLLFKIPQTATPTEYQDIIDKIKTALKL